MDRILRVVEVLADDASVSKRLFYYEFVINGSTEHCEIVVESSEAASLELATPIANLKASESKTILSDAILSTVVVSDTPGEVTL